ncbi:MAG TPA: CPBP family intramembrane glutamic endopeptidase [Bryobacteraceae bacterium]|nr:CPBP family intramembrane glutamic endopeptidase [Bryobacteraceae bacterium]
MSDQPPLPTAPEPPPEQPLENAPPPPEPQQMGDPAPYLPPEPLPERTPFWGYFDLALFVALAFPCMFVGGFIGLNLARAVVAAVHPAVRIPSLEPLAEQLGADIVLFSVLALLLRLQYDRPFWRSLGWRPAGIPLLLPVIAGLGCAIGVAILGTLIHIPNTDNPMVDLMKERTSAILMACFGVTIAPLTEELIFRGFLQPLLVRSLGTIPGILLASVPFGLLHYREYGDSWRHAILIGLAGAAFGWMRHRTGSTQASTFMHASYNALIFYAVL